MGILLKYLRLSQEDLEKPGQAESNSITSQRALIDHYLAGSAELSGMEAREFCDDGCTGTNFDRPQFQEMMRLVKSRGAACIIVKDLSRLGRNYIEVGDYLEHIFPFLGVRVIAVNDGYDSARFQGDTGGMDVAFRNLINDFYSRDLSEKVKSAMRVQMRQGRLVNHAPYGYQKSPEDKHRLVPDERTAPIVREIFRRVLAGESSGAIAADFNARRVPSPAAQRTGKDTPKWTHKAVLGILHNLKYTGASVNHKMENRFLRDRTQRKLPPSEWIVRSGMHEPLVAAEDFEQANARLKTHRPPARARPGRRSNGTYDRVYRCGHCGRKLQKTYGTGISFYCEGGLADPQSNCRRIRFDKGAMETALLEVYRTQMCLLGKRQKAQISGRQPKSPVAGRLAALSRQLAVGDAARLARYEDYREGRLSREEFLLQKQQIAQEQETLRQEIKVLEQAQERSHQTNAARISEQQTLAAYARACTSADAAIRQMYTEIDRVTVYGNTDVAIAWKFADLFAADGTAR